MRRRFLALAPLSALALAACGDSTAPRAATHPFAFTDPVGDTAVTASGSTIRALDARRVSGEVTDDSLILRIEFTTPVTAATGQAASALLGTISVDADGDSATGIPALTAPFPKRADIGAEFYIFIPDTPGTGVELYDIVFDRSAGSYSAAYAANTITMRIPLAAFGAAAGRLRIVGLLGTTEHATDLVPDVGSYDLGGRGGE